MATSGLSRTLVTLRKHVKGEVLVPGDPGYDTARTVWNGMIDRHPAVIVRCADAGDVPHALGAARAHGLDLSIRGGGHNIGGSAVCDDGVVIDLSAMKKIVVDPHERLAVVQPGATLHDLDAATQAHGLAVPLGINSTTGVAGLTLGGGFGWLTRRDGLTIDNLVSAEVVTADARSRRASDTESPDLFWAIRGGGGNFGVVTRFEFALHPIGPEVLAGLIVFPFSEARQILDRYRAFTASAPQNLNAWVILRQAPPLPFLPAAVHGRPIVALAVFYAGDVSEGAALVRPLQEFGTAHGAHVGAVPYVAWQQAFDPLLTPGARNYWKSHNFTELADGTLETLIDFAGRLPSPQCEVFVGLLSGALNHVPPEATAYVSRDARFVVNVHGRWDAAADDERCIGWARDFFTATAPFASRGAYVNFMTQEETDRVAPAYGVNYQRLVALKRRYDPENVFHLNQNIRP